MEMRAWLAGWLAWTSQIILRQEFLNQTQTGWPGLAWRWVVDWTGVGCILFMICVAAVLQQIITQQIHKSEGKYIDYIRHVYVNIANNIYY